MLEPGLAPAPVPEPESAVAVVPKPEPQSESQPEPEPEPAEPGPQPELEMPVEPAPTPGPQVPAAEPIASSWADGNWTTLVSRGELTDENICSGSLRWRISYDVNGDGLWSENLGWACPTVCGTARRQYHRQVECLCSDGQMFPTVVCEEEDVMPDTSSQTIVCEETGPCLTVLGFEVPRALYQQQVWFFLGVTFILGCLVMGFLCHCFCKARWRRRAAAAAPKASPVPPPLDHHRQQQHHSFNDDSYSEESSLVDVTITTCDGGGGDKGGTPRGRDLLGFESERETAPLVVRGAI